jgi:hypothetical protein
LDVLKRDIRCSMGRALEYPDGALLAGALDMPAKNCAMIAITYRLSAARNANQIIGLADGAWSSGVITRR